MIVYVCQISKSITDQSSACGDRNNSWLFKNTNLAKYRSRLLSSPAVTVQTCRPSGQFIRILQGIVPSNEERLKQIQEVSVWVNMWIYCRPSGEFIRILQGRVPSNEERLKQMQEVSVWVSMWIYVADDAPEGCRPKIGRAHV